MDYSKGEARRWRADDVTVDMLSRIQDEIDSMDANVHEVLLSGNLEQAIIINARLQQLKEVMMLPEQMISEARGDD